MLPPIIIFLIVLSILVFVHELGHFLVAKKVGIKVLEFGFGYPPRIWGKKIKGTIYSINWIPFGGFVRLLGQEKAEQTSWTAAEKKQAFFSQPKRAKVPVLIAGILGNLLLGVVCFSILYSKLGIPTPLDYIKIIGVVEGSPAEKAGLQDGDQIIEVAGQKVAQTADFIKIIEENQGQEVIIKTRSLQYALIPRENPPEGEGRLGVMITDLENRFYPWWQMPFLSAWYGIKEAVAWSLMILGGIGLTIAQLFKGVTPEVAGPVGIFQLTSAAAKQGILDLIQFVGILSINLGILNLLPFPALDGGHLMFVFLGKLIKEKKRDKIEHVINAVGFIFLLSLMLLVTVNDAMRLFKDSPLASFFKTLF
jgi:regulator of sigma E protease